MVAVCYAVGLAVVICAVQAAYTLIHLPITEQVGLGAGKYAVVAVDYLFIAELF